MIHTGSFINTKVGNTAKVHVTRVLRRSGLYLKRGERTSFPRNDVFLYDMSVPTVILEDIAYPLLTWLMKLYPINDAEKREFNYKLSSWRMIIDCVFGRLKS